MAVLCSGVIWGNISHPIDGENVLGCVAYKNNDFMLHDSTYVRPYVHEHLNFTMMMAFAHLCSLE